ncbi:hypothetical protein EYC80_007404 [Monilinia laxa]|uniref:Alcohol dehydrogenase-like N-terminal domain-containing protein n=1 Tax=Monilinia laxa TaxID=61186 RepID=A0A5N6JUJ5_MONLA|nr:hypothetical protein EYC80_007404 [Monilinia laxa]
MIHRNATANPRCGVAACPVVSFMAFERMNAREVDAIDIGHPECGGRRYSFTPYDWIYFKNGSYNLCYRQSTQYISGRTWVVTRSNFQDVSNANDASGPILITFQGIVIETGSGVDSIKKGDRVVMPFNVADGRCRNCEEEKTAFFTGINPGFAGGAYAYVAMGPYQGGQAQYIRVPYTEFNCFPLPAGKEHEADFILLADIFPTGWHGVVLSGFQPGESIAIFGTGPVGLMAAYSQASAQDGKKEGPSVVLENCIKVTRPTGGISVPGLYVRSDPSAPDSDASQEILAIGTGQCNVKVYNRYLRDVVISGAAKPSFIVSHEISIDAAPKASTKLTGERMVIPRF